MFFPGVYGGGGGLSNGAISRRNLIINGAMTVAQRGTSVNITDTSIQYAALDQHAFYSAGITSLDFTQSQDSDVPLNQGFTRSCKVTYNGTGESLVAGAAVYSFEHRIEGQDLQHLKWGTSNAEFTTFSFWFKSNRLGTYVVEILTNTTSGLINKSFNVLDSNWNKYEITFPPNTLVGIIDTSNSGLSLRLWAAAGTNFTTGVLNTDWTTSTPFANRAVGVPNSLSTGQYWQFTGLQFEVGNIATPFEHRPYALELSLCQRYLQKFGSASGGVRLATGQAHAIGQARVCLPYQKPMRATPSLIFSATSDFALTKANETTLGAITLGIANTGINSCTLTVFCSPAELVAGDATQLITFGTDKYFYLSARL